MVEWDGQDYQRRIAANLGDDPHGEVHFVQRYGPDEVLDAGCGTGRVAIELARRGVEVVGVDVSASMLAVARRRASDVTWIESDLADLDLERTFDVVVMAGNVMVFTPPETTADVVAACARHVAADGALVAGFDLDRDYDLATYDTEAAAAGLTLVERYSTWDSEPFREDSSYAVSVHRRA